MTAAELAGLQAAVAEQKARGEKPTIATALAAGPGTLAGALAAEAQGRGHVEFRKGVPVWMPGPARYRP